MSNLDKEPTSGVIDLDPDDVVVEGRKAEEPAPQNSQPRKSSSRGTAPLVGLALVAGLVGGGWFYRDVLASYFPGDEVSALRERLAAIDKTNEDLATRLAAAERLAQQLTTDIDAIESSETSQITGWKQLQDNQRNASDEIAALKSSQSAAAAEIEKLKLTPKSVVSGGSVSVPSDLAARVEALEKDLAALKSAKVTANANALDKQALTQTLSDLKAKVDAGVSFADEQARLATLVPAAGGLGTLAQFASKGVPTAAGLALELAALKPSLPTPDLMPKPEDEQGFWGQMLDAMSDVITIRDLDAVNWQSVAEKAQAFADAGDLPQAVATLDAVEAAKPPELEDWRARAQSRMSLESALALATESVTRQLAAAP